VPNSPQKSQNKAASNHSKRKPLYVLLFTSIIALASIGLIIACFLILGVSQTLPSKEEIRSTDLKIPLRIYSSDEKLVAEFGDERRKPLSINDTPDSLKHAILAGEDDRFFEHAGVDILGILRAIVANAKSGVRQQGASTITMQVARNYFLSREKTYVRKLREAMLAVKLESTLSKDEILELYINKIFLGHRAYGFAAAAEVYFGKDVDELTLSEQTILAGLPKAPSRDNPITNPDRSKTRRDYVLGRMLSEEWITQSEYDQAIVEPINASRHGRRVALDAPYVAEMVRAKLLAEFGEDVYWKGWHVYTTIDSDAQAAANELVEQLSKFQPSGDIIPAITLSSNSKSAQLFTLNKDIIELDLKAVKWAKKQLSIESVGNAPTKVSSVIKTGDIVYVKQITQTKKDSTSSKWVLSQLPQIQGSIISIEPSTGKILALNGGFDFYFNKYNRATQARRQPGSGVKPFLYAAALEKGYSPASIVSGAPIVTVDEASGTLWRPQNYSGDFFGPTPLRRALTKSMNTVSVRLLRSIEVDYAKQFMGNFGLPTNHLPNSLSLALGAGNLTPIEVAKAYATMANTGYLIEPFIIEKITDRNGKPIYTKKLAELCDTCEINPDNSDIAPRVISKESNFQIISMMQDVVKLGTARKALVLKRSDLAGKTGTTNDYVDAWFSGFNPSITSTVWVGFDTPQTMGRSESGGRAALPIWIDFMREALKTRKEKNYAIPEGIFAKEDPITGTVEYFSELNIIPESGDPIDSPTEFGEINTTITTESIDPTNNTALKNNTFKQPLPPTYQTTENEEAELF